MVQIDRITMKGFKSFANRTVLPFPDGFNAICGPNGSGKSNILDALVFVLGIRSARSLRAGKLEDLVFKGGEGRGPSEKAVVSLYLDNTDGEIPGEDEEVKVTRKVSSSGNSIYKLNDETVTRRKIVDVLSNARIYADGHNIIFQGDVTNLIEMSSRERRGIIDEISGIAEFDDKKEKAERELEKVEDKLKEARLILKEKENNLRKLEEEKRLSEKMERLEEELDKVRATITKREMERLEEELEEVKEEMDEKEEEIEEIEEEIGELDEEIEELQEEERAATAMAAESARSDLRDEISEVQRKLERKEARLESARKDLERLEEMITTLSAKKSAATEAVLDLGEDGVKGTVASLMDVEREYQKAIEVAAGSRLSNLVVDDDDTAQKCIDFLKSKEIGRATFLPLNKLSVRSRSRKAKELLNEDGVVDFAINLVEYDDGLEPAFRYVFGDTLVVEDLETAREHTGDARFVTLEGDLVRKSGAMTGGFYHKEDRGKKFSKNRNEVEEEIEDLEEEIDKLEERLGELRKQERQKEKEMEEKIGDVLDEIKELRGEREGLNEDRMSVRNEIGNLKVERTRIETQLENWETKKDSDSQRKYFEKDDFFDMDLDALEKRKENVLEKIREIGNVNYKAAEEYRAQKTLYEDLREKVDKIEEEKEAVLEMAESIEEKRVRAFMETFEAINENFQEIFEELSGGEAKLELEEEGDISSGLIIKARPEGKKELHLDSMSGGEKTITALSFLFAVQMYKPAPFYVLDEIDAALDKKNSKKVAGLIQNYAEDAQFILITHNDQTIQMADQVYGVSMEDGVSKAVSLELPQN